MLNERGHLLGDTRFVEHHGDSKGSGGQPEAWFDYRQEIPSGEEARTYVQKQINRLKDFSQQDWQTACSEIAPTQRPSYPGENGRRRVLIYVHGGLNTQYDTLERVRTLYQKILCAGYYPIFVNWRSSLFSSYFEQLLFVRQGKYEDRWRYPLGWPMAPVYLLADTMRSAGRLFLSVGQLVKNDYEGSRLCPSAYYCPGDPQKVAEGLKNNLKFDISSLNEDQFDWESLEKGVTWAATLPTQWATVPVIDGAGGSAWVNMLRRTSVLFHTDEGLGSLAKIYEKPVEANGGVTLFLKQLTLEVAQEPEKWEFTLVGHSMGVIVLNQLLREFGERLPIANIVYMAAACSIRDYQDTVWPYLQRHSSDHFLACAEGVNCLAPRAPQMGQNWLFPHIYHLMLHPRAEAQDAVLPPYLNVVPRGSLLVWLDGFLTTPPTPFDLTAGRFTNLMLTLEYTPQEIRNRVHVKVFRKGAAREPQHHMGFGEEVKFWEPRCWSPTVNDPELCGADKE
jgi:pimeloyl-ACP methyl ester carboxylesterase